MRNPFARTRIAHPDAPAFYSYHPGDEFTAGAMSLAYNARFSNPVQAIRGAGKITGAMQVTQPPQVRQSLVLPRAPLQGIPVGSMEFQGLTETDSQTY